VFKTKYVDQDDSNDEDPTEEELGLYGVYTMPEVRKYQANIRVNNENIVMEIDTGAAVSIIPQELYETKLSHLPLSKSKVVLKTYSGERLQHRSDHEHRQLPKEPAVSPETGPSCPAQESVGKNRRYPQRSRRPPERLMYS
jgi:hypothetical protein